MLRAIICSLLVLSLSACVSEPRDPSFRGVGAFDTKEAAKTRVSLGLTYLQNGNFAQAKFNLDKALEFAPRDGQAHFAMAFYYQQVDEFERAEESYEQALSFSNNDPDVLNSYGAFLCQQGNYDKAKGYFLRAVDNRNYVSSAETYENLALCSQSQGNNQEAIEYFNSALNHQPTRSDSLFLLTKLYVEEAQWEDAKKTLFKYERNAPISAESLYLQFQIAEGMNDKKTAMGYGEILKSMYPEHPNTKAYIASMGKFRPAASITRKERQPSQTTNTPEPNVASTSSSPQAITIIDTTKETGDKTLSKATTAVAATAATVATTAPSATVEPAVMSAPSEQETEKSATLKAAADATAALISQVVKPQGQKPEDTLVKPNESATISNEQTDAEVAAQDPLASIEQKTDAELESTPIQNIEDIEGDMVSSSELNMRESEQILQSPDSPIIEELATFEAAAQSELDDRVDDDLSVVEASTAEIQEEPVEQVEQEDREVQEIMSEDSAFHIVLPQENLYRISIRYNVKMSRLLEWNDLKDASDIRIGSKLRVKAPDNNE